VPRPASWPIVWPAPLAAPNTASTLHPRTISYSTRASMMTATVNSQEEPGGEPCHHAFRPINAPELIDR
jgi:hypothetical protein